MRIYWYWPFARTEEVALGCATARAGDEILFHVINREAAPTQSPCDQVVLVRDLPDVAREIKSSVLWPMSRASTYSRRARQRERTIAGIRPDVCHIHYVNRFTDWLLPRHEQPLVLSVHDILPHDSRLPSSGEQALLRRVYRRADALVVHHQRLSCELLQRFAVEESRIHVIPHQVFDYSGYQPTPLPEEPCVLFLGSLRHDKGLDVLLDAIAQTPPDIAFRIAGHGEPSIETALRRVAEDDPRLQVEIGFVTLQRKVELLRRASLVVLPYTSFSSQSGVLHDAYAHGRPVLATDVGALGVTVREDGTGVVVPPGDPAALSQAIGSMLADAAALGMYARRALAVREERSPWRVGPMLRSVYDSVAG